MNDQEKQKFPYPPVRCIRCGKGYWPSRGHECFAEDARAAPTGAEATLPPQEKPVKFGESL